MWTAAWADAVVRLLIHRRLYYNIMMTTKTTMMIIMRSSHIEWVQRVVPVKPLYGGRGGGKTDVVEGDLMKRVEDDEKETTTEIYYINTLYRWIMDTVFFTGFFFIIFHSFVPPPRNPWLFSAPGWTHRCVPFSQLELREIIK